MTPISLHESNGKLCFISPFNAATPSYAKSIGGKWDAKQKAWIFDPASKSAVLEMARTIYDWSPEDEYKPTITIQISADQLEYTHKLELGGRTIARRYERDSNVQLGAGVVLVSGKFLSCGGSRNHPCVTWKEAPVLQIEGLTATQLESLSEGTYTIVQSSDSKQLNTLLEEKDRLLHRLAEINTEIDALQSSNEQASHSLAAENSSSTLDSSKTTQGES